MELFVPPRFGLTRPALNTEMRTVHVLPYGSERPGDLATALRALCVQGRMPRHAWATVRGLAPRAEPPPTGPLPTLLSIVIAGNRRVANVDGHIVSVGDRIGSALVVEITQTAVTIEEVSGVRRRLVLRTAGVGRGF